MIEPNPPPSWMARASLKTALALFLFAPPEKMTMRRPSKADCTTWRTRSVRVSWWDSVFFVHFAGGILFDGRSAGSTLTMWSAAGRRFLVRRRRRHRGRSPVCSAGFRRLRRVDGEQADGFGFEDDLAGSVRIQHAAIRRRRVNRVIERDTAEAQGIFDGRGRARGDSVSLYQLVSWLFSSGDGGDLSGGLSALLRDQAQGSGVGIQAHHGAVGNDSRGCTPWRRGRKTARRAVLKALINGEDDHFSGSRPRRPCISKRYILVKTPAFSLLYQLRISFYSDQSWVTP